MGRLPSLLIALAFAALTLLVWAFPNRPQAEPPWPERIQGFAFSPYRADQDPRTGSMPTETQIDEDLALLAGKTNAVRTYGVTGTLGKIPALAAKHGINVALGTWIGADREQNEREIAEAISLAAKHRNVVRVLIGNEVVLRREIPLSELIRYLDRARKAIGQPVSTAEPWHVWLAHPELANHVDFLAVHILPYWEGVPVESAVDYTVQRIRELEAAFPDKPIVITEVGWPSNGRTRGSAVASPANEAAFLRRFLAHAEREKYIYYIMEAFDQPWKAAIEGAAGAYWGVFDAQRVRKFAFTEPIVRVPGWQALAAISVAAGWLLLGLFYADSRTLGVRGRAFLAVVIFATATVAVWICYDLTQQYITATSITVGALLLVGMIGVIMVLLTEAHEWAEAHWATARRRLAEPVPAPAGRLPKVSIHVPAYDEPPQMLIETLDALARLDYPDFEVLVIDNNTKDENVWRPVEEHCRKLGERFRFFHVSPLEGFKAGALNFALRHTAPDAEIIGVIDSDYVVEPDWLRDLVPRFENPRIAIVQAPQDYRDEGVSAFKAMCYAEYRGFFHIGMVTRNERNAIIQHGTMTLVRRHVLERSGGWAEWCITEDAELGLRIFEAGYEAAYVPRSYGRGLMPDTFIDFKKQRHRWAYGAMQILKAHARDLLTFGGPLTPGQRYHFLAGWLPWIADGFSVLFNLAALAWTVAMAFAPERFDPPLMTFSLLPLSLFTFKLAKLFHLYSQRIGATGGQTLAAAVAGLSLTHTIGRAVLKGLFTRNEPFFRTPKVQTAHALPRALAAAREETLLMLALWLAAWSVYTAPGLGSPDRVAWAAVLVVQSVPLASSLLVSLISALAPRRALAPATASPSAERRLFADPFPGAVRPAHASSAGRWLVPFITTPAIYALVYVICRVGFSMSISARGALTDLVVLTAVCVCCFALSRRLVPFLLLQVSLISLLLVGNALKMSFYGGPIMPDDLYALPALLMILEGWMFWLAVAALAVPVILLLVNLRLKPVALAGGLAGLAALAAPVALAPAELVAILDYWVGNSVWNQRANFESRGAALHLVQETARLRADRDPEPTVDQVYAAMEATYREPARGARFQQVALQQQARRNVHLIVLESFWDASQLVGAGLSRDPLDADFRALWQAAGYSTALVPVFGGYTANTEFEVLCGYPVLRDGVKFERRLTNAVPCLPAVLGNMGYRTAASHPNVPAFWNRQNVYPRIGFEKHYSLRDFVQDDVNGEFLSDQSLYRQVRDHMRRDADGRPLFNYVLTYFGHWRYLLNERRPAVIATTSAVEEVEGYVNVVHYKSRETMEHLRAILEEDPEALVVILGDHLPYLGPNFAAYVESGILSGSLSDFDGAMMRRYVSTPLIVVDGSRGPVPLGAIPAYRVPALILYLLEVGAPTMWDFTRQPEGLKIRPLPGMTLVLDRNDRPVVCYSEDSDPVCDLALQWRRSVTILNSDIFSGRRHALTMMGS